MADAGEFGCRTNQRSLSDANRTGHLPKLFDDVLYRLRREGDAQPLISDSGAADGNIRYVQGYSPSMLVEECGYSKSAHSTHYISIGANSNRVMCCRT
jgi:hypothetical protein